MHLLGVSPQRQRHPVEIARQVFEAVAFHGGGRAAVRVNRHRGIVHHHRGDGDAGAHRGFHIQPHHTEGGIAHKVDDRLFGRRHLGAHRQPQAVPQLGGLAPADKTARRPCLPEGRNLLARAARFVGYDGVVQVHGVHNVPHHPVGVQRHLVAGQPGAPFRQPRLVDGADFIGQPLVGGARRHALRLNLVNKLPQRQLGIAQDGVRGAVVLVDVALAVGQVNQRLAGGNRHGKTAFGKAHAHAKHHIGIIEEPMHRPGLAGTANAQRQRVVFGESAFALQRGHHGNLQILRQLHQFGAGLGIQHPLPSDDDRMMRGHQPPHAGGNRRRVGGSPHRRRRDVVKILLADIVSGQILGDFQ